MRSILFSFALLMVGATINCSNADKSKKAPLTDYQVFAQKYEAAFGEKPSDQVWTLGKDRCKSCRTCKNNCSRC